MKIWGFLGDGVKALRKIFSPHVLYVEMVKKGCKGGGGKKRGALGKGPPYGLSLKGLLQCYCADSRSSAILCW